MIRTATSVLFLLISLSLTAQNAEVGAPPDWAQMMYADAPDVEAVKAAFREYYAAHPFTRNRHTQNFKRWLRKLETYEYQVSGDHLNPAERAAAKTAQAKFLNRRNAAHADAKNAGNWTAIGPFDWDHDAAGRSYAPGSAHVYTIEHCPADPDVMYAGTATAGLWRSDDRGFSWTNLTKDLPVNRVYSVEAHPTNCGELLAPLQDGIFRSTDGGSTWTETGDAAFQNTSVFVRDLKFHAGSTTRVWAAADNALYRSTDGGLTWTSVMTGKFWEIEFHPTDDQTMYVVRNVGNQTQFWKSTDGGITFSQQTTGWPTPAGSDHNERAEIAVSPAEPNKVVALLTGSTNGGSGLFGIYISTDAGASWTFQCCGPQPGGPASATNINMMGWDDQGLDDGGQYYYDLALAVSPTDADRIFVAGVNLWVSSDGGASFTCPAKWSHPEKPNYVHADNHDINYYPNGDLWVANDGGIFYSDDDGANFTRRVTGILGSDFWGFGVGNNNDELMTGGAYHNGTLLRNGDVYLNGWACMDGGDGVGGGVNPIFENQLYTDRNIKTMPASRTTAPATRGYALEPDWSYRLTDFSQIEWGSDNYNVHYFGREDALYKTEDDNRTVSMIHDFGETVIDIEVAWTDTEVMYVVTNGNGSGRRIYRSGDGGVSWADVTPAATAVSFLTYDVAVSYEDENLIWAARRGDTPWPKVQRSTDGGQSWTTVEAGLPGDASLTNIIVQRGSNNQLYVGTTRAVYTSANGGNTWTLYADGLPAATRSRQLAISYRTGKLYNATNRSVWAGDLATPTDVEPQVAVDKYFTPCARDTFKFADNSTVGLSGPFSWSFPGASWVSSTTERNPRVLYANEGTYDVSLTVGGNTQTLPDFIEVGNGCAPESFAGNALVCTTTDDHFVSDGPALAATNTLTLMAWVKPNGIQNSSTGIIFSDDPTAGLNFRGNNNEIGYHWAGGSTHWGWSSGVTAPADEWSFVAMVVTPTSVTFYVNEQEVTRNITMPAAAIGNFRVGSYRDWSSRNFDGEIDEVAIWDRSLTRDEIRRWRHLTLERQATPGDALNDPGLKVYLQFNEETGRVYDRVGTNHGTLVGGATRALSSAPIGTGTSSKITITAGGAYDFAAEGVELVFPGSGTLPMEEIVVTRLAVSPFALPESLIHPGEYWIINNYGNEAIAELSSLTFSGISGVAPADLDSPEQFVLFKRTSNADTEDWGSPTDQADAAVAGAAITFSTGNGVTSFSQFAIGQKESLILPVSFSDFWLTAGPGRDVGVHWTTASEVDGDYFVVEHALPSGDFAEVGRLPATGGVSGAAYGFTHKDAPAGRNLYRIRSVDLTGLEDVTEVRSIVLTGEDTWARVYPNPLPATGSLRLESAAAEPTLFELYDAQGRLLRRTQFTGSAYLRLPNLPAGSYAYRMVEGGRQASGRLVKVE